jgi:hypothetical protein
MAKYEVQWTYERWYRVEIEADSYEQAQQKFWEGDYENEQMFGGEIQEGVEIEEVK